MASRVSGRCVRLQCESWKGLRLAGGVAAAAARRLSKSENAPGILCEGGGRVEGGMEVWFVNNPNDIF